MSRNIDYKQQTECIKTTSCEDCKYTNKCSKWVLENLGGKVEWSKIKSSK